MNHAVRADTSLWLLRRRSTLTTGSSRGTDAATGHPANPTATGWFYVQVTDTNGCTSNIDSLEVIVLPKPRVNTGPDQYICGDSAPCVVLQPTITGAPGPFTYNWSPGTSLNDSTIANPCARPDSTTIYALTVVAGNGCASDFTLIDTTRLLGS